MAEIPDDWTGRMIEMIRAHPELYDKNNQNYFNRGLRDATWAQIAFELGVSSK